MASARSVVLQGDDRIDAHRAPRRRDAGGDGDQHQRDPNYFPPSTRPRRLRRLLEMLDGNDLRPLCVARVCEEHHHPPPSRGRAPE